MTYYQVAYKITPKGKTIPISEAELKEQCPNLYSYLLKSKDELLQRGYFVNSNKQWFELWNSRKMQHFYAEKFVFSELGLVNDFVRVNECFYTDSACGMELKDEFQKYSNYIYKYLNSNLLTFIYKKISVPKANGYSIYKNAFLKLVPIIIPNDEKLKEFEKLEAEKFEEKLAKIVDLTEDELRMINVYISNLHKKTPNKKGF